MLTARTILLLAAAAISPLSAQSPTDARLLARLEAAMLSGDPVVAPRSADGTVRNLVDGLREVDSWRRTGRRGDVEAALAYFNAAASRQSGWPWPRYLAARTHLLLDKADAPVLASVYQRPNESHLRVAIRLLDDALDRDSTFIPARELLAALLLPSGDRELDNHSRHSVERERTLAQPLVELQIVRARALRTERAYREALAEFEAAVFRGGDRSLLALERARTLMALGDTVAAIATYWNGVDHLTATGRIWYRQDLGWIVSEDSLASFDAEPLEGVGLWLQRFWAERDAAAANTPDQRLRHHLARWVTAHERFRVPSPSVNSYFTRFWYIAGGTDCIASATDLVDSLPMFPPMVPGDPRFREPLLDHRGLLWMRHGAPIARTAVVAPDAEGQSEELNDIGLVEARKDNNAASTLESWVYWVEGDWRAFHLGGSDAFGSHAPTTIHSYLDLAEGPWLALAQILPKYQKAAQALNPDRRSVVSRSCSPDVTESVSEMRADAYVAITTDSDSPPYLRPWNAVIRSFAVGSGSDTSGRALVTFAIPVRPLKADTLSDGRLSWRVHFRSVAYRGADGQSRALDTTRTFVTDGVPRNAKLMALLEFPLGAGRWQLAVKAWQKSDSSGAYALRRELVVDSGPGLTITDIVTGIAGGLHWPAGAEFPVNTLGAWPERSEVELWFQVRGLQEGTPYRTRFEILPADPGRKERISIAADEISQGPITTVQRTLGLERLRPGNYRLVVTVEAGGETARREQEILVVKR